MNEEKRMVRVTKLGVRVVELADEAEARGEEVDLDAIIQRARKELGLPPEESGTVLR